jgi:Tol biopolymer transport system component
VGPPAWSPDGREVAFERCDGRNDGVFVISALGGTERKLASVTCFYTLPRPVAWMSSGNEILMVDRCQPGKPFDLVSLSLATGARHCLSSLGADQSGDSGDAFAISPDGTTVAFLRTTASLCCDLYKMPVTGGAVTRVISAGNRGCNFLSEQGCSGIMWTSDGQSLVFVDDQSKLGSLLRVSADGGSTERETGYPAIGSLTRDAARFVYAQRSMADPPSIWEAKFSSAGGSLIHQGKVISSQYPELDAQPSPDGTRLVWMSMRTGGEEIFVSDINGQNQVRLTHFDRYSGTPRWSPDSKSIAFDSYELGKRASVFLIDPDGRNLREVISAAFDCVVPSWSHDGHSIYYSANHDGVWQVWKHNLDTGADKQLTRQGAFDALESTDGKTVYYTRFYEPGIWKVPAGGGAETLVVHDLPQIGFWGHYAVTDDGIYFLDYDGEPHSVINFYRFNTGKITPVLTLAERPARLQPSLSASADGKALYFTQYDRQGVIKMMEFAK